jgi:hypothetical protein
MLSYKDQCLRRTNRGSGVSRIELSVGDVEMLLGDMEGDESSGTGFNRRTSSRKRAYM